MVLKKTVIITALIIMIMAFSTSCNGKSGNVGKGGDIFERMRNTTYEVRLLFPGWDPQIDKDMVVKAFNDKLTELGYPGLSIRLDGQDWGSWNDRGNAIVLSGGDYDLVHAGSWWNFYSDALAGGAWAPWDSYLDQFPEYAKLIAPWKDKMYQWSGADANAMHIYRVPNIKEYATYPCEIRWNKTVADKLGITEKLRAVKNIHDLDPYLELYKNTYGNKGMAVLAVDSNPLLEYFKLRGNILYPAYDPDTDRYETGAFMPWFDDYIALRREWRAKGYIPEYEQTELWDDLVRKFGPESFLVYFNSGKPGGEAELNTSAQQVLGFQWGTTFITPAFMDIDTLMGNCFAINAKSKNIEAAAFMHMLLNTNKELTNIINFGIEGVHYTLDADGILIKKEPSKYYPNLMWMLGNRFLCYRLPGEPDNLAQLYEDFNNSAITYPNFGFPGPNAAAWAGVDTDIVSGVVGALTTQYERSIQVGSISDADIADIKNRLIQANYKAVGNVYDREYNAWKANK
ncbi:MAG: ABC transporter substrate-binding protein [Treponema sp.]|nr:ABC transporter substrate-binding protein [Treponema sp.]